MGEKIKDFVELCYKLKLSVEIKAEHSNFYQGVLFSVANKDLPKTIVRM